MITGEETQSHVHLMRSQHDAIMTGIGTVRKDNPRLTVRAVQTPRQPLRVIVDTRFEIDAHAAIVADGNALVVVCIDPDAPVHAATAPEESLAAAEAIQISETEEPAEISEESEESPEGEEESGPAVASLLDDDEDRDIQEMILNSQLILGHDQDEIEDAVEALAEASADAFFLSIDSFEMARSFCNCSTRCSFSVKAPRSFSNSSSFSLI